MQVSGSRGSRGIRVVGSNPSSQRVMIDESLMNEDSQFNLASSQTKSWVGSTPHCVDIHLSVDIKTG